MNEIDLLYDHTIHYKNYNEKIHLIYVYKEEKSKTCYIGRTSCLKRRHRQHKNGTRHKNGNITYDSVNLFFKYKNIDFTEPVILEQELNAKESQIQEHYWVEYYKNNNWVLLNKAKVGERIGSLGATLKWDYETCKNEN